MENWFSKRLVTWYKTNKRDLPWRNEKDPYKIWLSEIILQQTQVKQGLSYYLAFTKKYPHVKALAKAQEDEVLKLWQGLGYYSRARNLHATAKNIVKTHKSIFPSDYDEIMKLKGVGVYSAAAISSFAFNGKHAVVDGNVYRLLSRLFGIDSPVDSTNGKKAFQKLANALLDQKNPGIYNQAIMEFGSQYCKPKAPDCEACIFASKCYAKKTNSVELLPVKLKKTRVKLRYFNYLVVIDKNKDVLVHKRENKDIWKGLYEFPLIETQRQTSLNKLTQLDLFKTHVSPRFHLLHSSKPYTHILSHQKLLARFYIIDLLKPFKKGAVKIKLMKLESLAFPRLIEKFLRDCDLKELF